MPVPLKEEEEEEVVVEKEEKKAGEVRAEPAGQCVPGQSPGTRRRRTRGLTRLARGGAGYFFAAGFVRASSVAMVSSNTYFR